MRVAVIGLSLITLAACRSALDPSGGPDASYVVGDTLVLAPGQEVVVGAAFRVTFLEVSSDSRCASDVVCVWAGDAAVEIGLAVGEGPTHPFTLHTLAYPPSSAEYAGYRVSLLELTPYPITTHRIEPGEYRAHLEVARLDADAMN
jgi:hypothetical protein